MYQGHFFEVGRSYERLDKGGDPLSRIDELVDWSSLEPMLEVIRYKTGEKGGRPGLDPLVILIQPIEAKSMLTI